MTIGSLTQLWAVGALVSLVVVIYLGLMILRESNDKKAESSLSPGSADTGSTSPLSGWKEVSPAPPGQEVTPPDSSGGSND